MELKLDNGKKIKIKLSGGAFGGVSITASGEDRLYYIGVIRNDGKLHLSGNICPDFGLKVIAGGSIAVVNYIEKISDK